MKQTKTLLLLIIMLSALISIAYAKPFICNGPYKGKTPTPSQIKAALKEKTNLCGANLKNKNLNRRNLSYMDLSGINFENANLNNANLTHANLHKAYFLNANLSNANLQEANLSQATLKNANLSDANLRGSQLFEANLTQANLSRAQMALSNLEKANLTGANLTDADLSWARLINTDMENATLTNATLDNADLTGVKLTNTDITNARFHQTNLSKVFYAPYVKGLPNLTALSMSQQFRQMDIASNQSLAALTQLRSAYKKIGIRPMERKITTMIKVHQMKQAWRAGGWGYLESTLSYVLFYVTCDYGSKPGRALLIFLFFIIFSTIPYRFALSHTNKSAGILIIWPPKRYKNWDHPHPINSQANLELQLKSKHNRSDSWLTEEIRLWRIAFYYSFLNAFSIGYHDLNIRNWITRIQARDYTLKGKGWVRILAGIQPIISAYLIVLWALTYFGSPFKW